MPAYLNQSKIFKYHVANLKSLELAINNTAIAARKAISEQNQPGTLTFTRLYAFLLGAWAETRLHKLLNENGAFSTANREIILSQQSQIEQWLKAVEISFREYHKIPKAKLTEHTLLHTSFHRLNTINIILDKDLRSVIEVRNKLAHGQWVYPLNSDCTDVEQKKCELIRKENILSLQFKKSLITCVAEMIHDLSVSLPTFERDFDKHYKKIISTRINLVNRKFSVYQDGLIEKRKRGIKKRKNKVD
jgi:hypothetical protein